jgi:hypothetical protein
LRIEVLRQAGKKDGGAGSWTQGALQEFLRSPWQEQAGLECLIESSVPLMITTEFKVK